MHMLHHVSLGVEDLARSARFYDGALIPLGYVRVWEHDEAIGYGPAGGGDKFAIKLVTEGFVAPVGGFHLAFTASSRDQVNTFYAGAMAAGGTGNGPPGLRSHYGPHYYAAFVIDPDGHHVEAVINTPTDVRG